MENLLWPCEAAKRIGCPAAWLNRQARPGKAGKCYRIVNGIPMWPVRVRKGHYRYPAELVDVLAADYASQTGRAA